MTVALLRSEKRRLATGVRGGCDAVQSRRTTRHAPVPFRPRGRAGGVAPRRQLGGDRLVQRSAARLVRPLSH